MYVASPERIPPERVREVTNEDGYHRVTAFVGAYEGGDAEVPEGFLVEFRPSPGGRIDPHFHKVAQFQVVVGGDGHLGKRPVPPISFHFADISTPYGPITPADEQAGIDFFTLRARRRPGIWYMPGSKHEMLGRAGRNIAVNVEPQPLPATGVATDTLIEQHDDGLASFRLRLAPGELADGPTTVGTVKAKLPASKASGSTYSMRISTRAPGIRFATAWVVFPLPANGPPANLVW